MRRSYIIRGIRFLWLIMLRNRHVLGGVILLLVVALILVNLRPAAAQALTLTTGVDAGSGSVAPNCPVGCVEAFGASITVTATPSPGWQFSSWSTQTNVKCSANPCTFTMPASNVVLHATFAQVVPEYPLGLPVLAMLMILSYAVIKRRHVPQN